MIVAQHRATTARCAANGAGKNDVGIIGMDCNVAAFGIAHRIAIAPQDGAFVGRARHGHRTVILLGAINLVGKAVVGVEVIKLSCRLIVDGGPCGTAIKRHAGPTVVAFDHTLGVLRVNPQVVIVTVRGAELGKGATAIDGFPGLDIKNVERIRILGIGHDMTVIPRAGTQIAILVDVFPGLTTVVGAKQAAVFSFHNGPNAFRHGRGDRHAGLTAQTRRQTGMVGELLPRIATVGGFVETAIRSSAGESPGGASRFPQGRI